MGRDGRVCAGCKCAWTEYDESLTCSECDGQFFEDCGCASEVVSLAGIGLVCDACNNYNTAGSASDSQLYDFLLEKFNLEDSEVRREWAAAQETRVLPCYRCKSETCKVTHENEITLTDKEIEDMDSSTSISFHFGQCCICANKEEKCKDCQQENKRIKLK